MEEEEEEAWSSPRLAFDSFLVLSSLELIMLAGLWARLIYSTIVICSNTGWKRWYQVQSVFFEQLGTISVFSAMQLLFYITPKVFVPNVLSMVTRREHPDYCRALLYVLFAIQLRCRAYPPSCLGEVAQQRCSVSRQ